jgi:hypothetical protein
MGFELCYLPDMPAVLRALAGTGNSIERWWQQIETAKKRSEGAFKVINALAMAASYDPETIQFLGMRLPVTCDTCEVIEERWANWLRQDPVIAIESMAHNLGKAEGTLYRLRRERSVQFGIRCTQVRSASDPTFPPLRIRQPECRRKLRGSEAAVDLWC